MSNLQNEIINELGVENKLQENSEQKEFYNENKPYQGMTPSELEQGLKRMRTILYG